MGVPLSIVVGQSLICISDIGGGNSHDKTYISYILL
jgi:hypothetical protein